MREQHLGFAQAEIPAVADAEVEPGEDLRLHLGIEIHERVAAGQQVNARDRCVPQEVVTPEDQGAAQILVEDIPIAFQVKVLFQQWGRNAVDLAGGVGTGAGLRQSLLVHIRRIDLDAPAERFDAHLLGQDHRQRVCLLTRGAAGAPQANWPVPRLCGEEARDDLVGEIVPGSDVPEEGRDIDKYRVEQTFELVGMDLEVVYVVAVARHADGLHLLVHAAHQAGAFVS